MQEVCCGGRRSYSKGVCRGKEVAKPGEVLIFYFGVGYGSHGYGTDM